MIIWSGWGAAAILPLILLPLVYAIASGSIDQNRANGLGMIVAGIVGVLFVRWVDAWRERSNPSRVLVDPQTQQQVVYRRRDSLFFVPLRFLWVPYAILVPVGIVRLFV